MNDVLQCLNVENGWAVCVNLDANTTTDDPSEGLKFRYEGRDIGVFNLIGDKRHVWLKRDGSVLARRSKFGRWVVCGKYEWIGEHA